MLIPGGCARALFVSPSPATRCWRSAGPALSWRLRGPSHGGQTGREPPIRALRAGYARCRSERQTHMAVILADEEGWFRGCFKQLLDSGDACTTAPDRIPESVGQT